MLLLMLFLCPSIVSADANKIFKDHSKAVVVIIAYDSQGAAISQGSGFIVRADGAVVTNYHVISNAADITIKAGSKVLRVEGFLHIDQANDVVILKADGKGLPTLKIGNLSQANIGEKVYVIGSPKGLENTISDGILSGIRELTSEKKVLQISAPISPGSSGGPVFNERGEVLGIATFLLEGGQNLNFAMPASLIQNYIRGGKVTPLKDAEIEDYKKTVEYWFYLGLAYQESRMYKEAIEAAKQAIRIKPDYFYAHNSLGLAYKGLGMYKEALEAYKQAIRIKPDEEVPYYNLGGVYIALGMYREAIEATKQAIRIKPDAEIPYHNLGIVYAKAGLLQEAIEATKQAIRIKPDFADAHFNLAADYANLGMNKDAIEQFKQTIRVKPDYAAAYYYLGLSYLRLSDRGMALEQYKILKNLDPEQANKLFNLIYK